MAAALVVLPRYPDLVVTSIGEAYATRVARKSLKLGSPHRAAIFRNGVNQAVRLPQSLRFSDEVCEVQVIRQGRGLVITPVRPGWSTFFNSKVKVPENFLAPRDDDPPQEREPFR